ncbi:hypothetical protein [Hymenobacter nivis]|uniref:hypothetical protein n=1 Tax=Hymenobacter nivis TaxID=1850093 RepID=UPI00112EEF0B|nr:hypothetical protein [Hymenobacter nivis]
MLARIVERLLDGDNYPTAVKTIFVVLFFAVALLLFNNFEKTPTQAEEIIRNQNSSFAGALWNKLPSPSAGYQLFIGKEFDWMRLPNLTHYYPAPFTSDSIRASSNYQVVRKASLPFYVEAGDSLIKKKGELTVLVKRGKTTRVFNYCSF